MPSVAQALERGNTQALFDALDEEVVWTTGAKQKGYFPFGGTYKGHRGVEEMLAHFAKRFRYNRIAPREIDSFGDIVWGIFDVELESSETSFLPGSTPAAISTVMAIRWRLRNNKIVEHQAFFDTATLLLAPIAVPRATR